MSKEEVARFKKLFNDWHRQAERNSDGSEHPFIAFLLTYRPALINALEFYACDK
jgi:hypothetical protein